MQLMAFRNWKLASPAAAILMALPAVPVAQVITYEAKYEASTWTLSDSQLLCELRHPVPGYGYAVFSKHAGDPLRFSIHSLMRLAIDSEYTVLTTTPDWHRENKSLVLDEFQLIPGKQPVQLPGALSARIYSDLTQGLSPRFRYGDWTEGNTQTNISLSPINFKAAEEKFQVCISKQLSFGFVDVRKKNVYFRVNKSDLDRSSQSLLQKIAAYVKLDAGISQVRITGHTDNRGDRRANRRLAAKRAKVVVSYLRKNGVGKSLVKIDSSGIRKPLSTNRTPRGRAENRSVTIELVSKPESY